MSGTKRKLSFLAFTPQDNEDQVLLDEEMDRVVWNEALPGPSHLGVAKGSSEEPCRDVAAPRPKYKPRESSTSTSTSDLSPSQVTAYYDVYCSEMPAAGSSSWETLSAGSTRTVIVDEKKVQFDRTHPRMEDYSSDDSEGGQHGRFQE